MTNLEKLKARKAELQTQIEREKTEMQATLREIRADLEPANLLENTLMRFFKIKPNRTAAGGGRTAMSAAGGFGGFAAPLFLLSEIFIRDPRLRFLLKWIAPFALGFLQKKGRSGSNSAAPTPRPTNFKKEFYARLRKSVAAMRQGLKNVKTESSPAATNVVEVQNLDDVSQTPQLEN